MKSLSVVVILAYWISVGFSDCNVQYTADTRNISGVLRDVFPCSDSTSTVCGSQLNAGQPSPICVTNPKQWICAHDFERDNANDPGAVQYYLNATAQWRMPNLSTRKLNTIHDAAMFSYWYRDNDQFNIPFNLNLVVSNAETCNSLVYQYTNLEFFPINGQGFGNMYQSKNFAFTLVSNLRFTYQGNEHFNFLGDDDLWVFINDRLAMDLGGVHSATGGSLDLTWPDGGCDKYKLPDPPVACYTLGSTPPTIPCACLLGLTGPGNSYTFDLYYNERHTSKSTLQFSTSLFLQCAYYDHCGVCIGNGQSCCTCKAPDLCHTAKCDVLTPTCIYAPKECPTSNNKCLLPTCNTANGNCGFANLDCDDQNACTTDTCDSTIGCLHPLKSCDDGNKCTTDSCDKTSGCINTQIPNCSACSDDTCGQSNECFTYQCSKISGVQQCTTHNTTCSDGNACTNDLCVVGKGCTYPNITCDDNNPCTIDSCDSVLGCQHTNITCDDDNACTIDTCIPLNKEAYNCSYTQRQLPASNKCVAYFCDPAYGVLNQTTVCPSACTGCDPANGCTACPGAYTTLEKVATGIGAGVIAGIVVAIVVALVIASLGSKKAYDVYRKHKGSIQQANNNPLYQEDGRKGDNPFFEDAAK